MNFGQTLEKNLDIFAWRERLRPEDGRCLSFEGPLEPFSSLFRSEVLAFDTMSIST
jgi:hypothetical protein